MRSNIGLTFVLLFPQLPQAQRKHFGHLADNIAENSRKEAFLDKLS